MKQTPPKINKREKPKSKVDDEKLRCLAPVFNRRTKSAFRVLTLPKTDWGFEEAVADAWPSRNFIFSGVVENGDARKRGLAMAKKLTVTATNAEFILIEKSDLEEVSADPILKRNHVVILDYPGSWNTKYLKHVNLIMSSKALAVGGYLLVIFALKPIKLTGKTAKEFAEGGFEIMVAEKGSASRSIGIPGAIISLCEEDYSIILEPAQPLITYNAASRYPNVIMAFKRTK